MTQAVAALWCAHCNELEQVDSCRACRCRGNERVIFVMPHVVCYGCASEEPAELISELLQERRASA